MSYQEIVTYKSAQAYYNIKVENKNTVVAELQQYLGKQEHMPPKKVVYIKSEAPYTSSLLNDLANAIPQSTDYSIL